MHLGRELHILFFSAELKRRRHRVSLTPPDVSLMLGRPPTATPAAQGAAHYAAAKSLTRKDIDQPIEPSVARNDLVNPCMSFPSTVARIES